MTNYMKTCSFLHAQFTETTKTVGHLFVLFLKFMVNSSFIEKTYMYVVGTYFVHIMRLYIFKERG